jgi:phosphoribosylaminoimidazolecarboxamide formyltransferase / IMP cyclohydrolase
MSKRALISVYDKKNIIHLAEQLIRLGYDIISTGGTSLVLEETQIPVIRIESITSFPEILGGRVKTLHPSIFGGILARRDEVSDMDMLLNHHIEPIDLVVVNLYPYQQASKSNLSEDQLIEMIDIGGVSLLRAAAKNYQHVTVITDPKDYSLFFEGIDVDLNMRRKLAGKAFSVTASYDAFIAEHFHQINHIQYPDILNFSYQKYDLPRYGENPHQSAAIYRKEMSPSTILDAQILHGKALSYNNIKDAEAALHILSEYIKPTVVVVKHTNPCAVSSKDTLIDAWHYAYEADSVSVFGGIVATNQVIDLLTAKELNRLFLEIIIAKGYDQDALQVLKQKKNLRIITYLDPIQSDDMEMVSIDGGILIQEKDKKDFDFSEFNVVTEQKPSEDEIKDLMFALRTVRHVKSNAIVLAKHETTIGIGAGQMNRIGSTEISIKQAGIKAQGAVLASDGFLPMTDTITSAHQAGIKAIIQPGGSIADQEVIALCNVYGIAMVFTQKRHFKH